MADILLILFTLALLTLSRFLPTLLAMRTPGELRIKPIKLKQAPDIMADLFDQSDQLLSDLGFSRGHWASIHTTPSMPGVSASLVRLYHHKKHPIIARVLPPHSIFSTDSCEVTFLSISKRKTFLVTNNGTPDLFPPPPKDRAIILNSRFGSVDEQFDAHIREMSQLGLTWLDRSKERGEATWVFRLANRYETKRIQWLNDNQYVKQLEDGSSVPRIGIVMDFMRRLVTGRERIPLHESTALPSNRAAFLFLNWQQARGFPPPISTQLGLFLGSSLAFVLLAALFWDWTIALLLPVVICIHEAGHWLAMRVFGYRNMQLQMLPLVGGITLGHETGHNAVHRILISLMGPLTGIIIGIIVFIVDGMEGGWISKLGITLLLVNYISLLPFMPLDGGQLLKDLIPARRYVVLITLEWLGSGILLLLGWLTDSLLLAALALLPFFSGYVLIKRRRVLDSLEGDSDGVEQPSLNSRIASVIQAIDNTDKTYRPLKRKVREIADVIYTQGLKQVSPTFARVFLVVYFATILLPPVIVYASSPGVENIRMWFSPDSEETLKTAQERTMSYSMSQMVMELADRHRDISDPYRSQGERIIMRPPATHKSITHAEMLLGIKFDEEYLQFLKTSNGFINQLSSPDEIDYLIYPVEDVVRFAQKLPEIVNRFRAEASSNGRHRVRIKEASDSIEVKSEELNLNQLAPMLVIGNPHEGNFLLLDTVSQSVTSSSLYEVFETPSGLEGRRFKSLRHYLTYHLSMLQAASLNQ
jgi:Zn-dependent protease